MVKNILVTGGAGYVGSPSNYYKLENLVGLTLNSN